MLGFYLIAGSVALVTALLLVRPLISGRTDAADRDTTDAQVFKDQLAEVERDLERGTITAEEAAGARVEVSRRLLAASARAKASGALGPAPQGSSGLVAGLALIGTPALAAALYFALGVPGLEDRPFAERRSALAELGRVVPGPDRPSQAEMEAEVARNLPPAPEGTADAEYRDLVARLEQTVADRPDDLTGQKLLGNAYMQLGRWSDAAKTYARAVEIAGAEADAELFGSRAESLILAAGGYVSPMAEKAIADALAVDPTLPVARYYAGLALRQSGRLEAAVEVWQQLRRESAPDAPYVQWLDMLLAETLQALGGQVARAPAGAAVPGPTPEEIEAANALSADERLAMVEGMVARLEGRLLRDGGTPQEWGQLMASYATLNRPDQARAAYDLALSQYPDGAEAEALRAHAASLGLAEAPAGPAPGPSQAQIDAAGEMSPEDRAAMIGDMVARLESRLTEDGGSAEEWLRLIRSYAQLGRMDEANRVYRLAETALTRADDPARGFVKEQALILGVDVE